MGAQFFVQAQNNLPFFKGALKENRDKFYESAIMGIQRNLAMPLDEQHEENWINAFNTVNLLKYKTVFVTGRLDYAGKNIYKQSNEFKKAFLELINSDYPGKYATQIKPVFKNASDDAKLMAMAANHLLPSATTADVKTMLQKVRQRFQSDPDNAVLLELNDQLTNWGKQKLMPSLQPFFSKDFLPGQVVVFSFQRENRNFPGLAIIRKADGSFVKNTDGTYFSVGQLARSQSNMPGYISLGNTPQGIFRMDGFDTSKSFFIGPTTNIQLTMPFEYKASHFYQDSSLVDSVWSSEQYAKLLPVGFKSYHPLFGTYYAGKAGRNEIIAHGTTIKPGFYKTASYYPYTPTAGCLATREEWNPANGFLQYSDQLKLTEAIRNAGGAKGYLIVIEINNKKLPVSVKEIIRFLQ